MFRTLFALSLILLHASSAKSDESLEFNRDIRPILSNHCFTCHGPDAGTREAGLRLDDPESATGELDSGEIAIVSGDPDASELIYRIRHEDESLRMPPVEGGKPLSGEQIAILTEWIRQGGQYEPHWAFVAPQRPEVPAHSRESWAINAIDDFVAARLDAAEMRPADRADKTTLIRRVAFDVTGLPPTLAEIDEYLADNEPGAYERMVDRYLQSSAYGEHMASAWLDLARYADTNGYQYDTERQQWVWRDWVIDAYNRNLPFDQFSTEQLAGDLLPNATPQQRLATGFNRNHGITIEGGIIDEEYRVEYVMDRVVTTGSTWMGLTVGCARCHEHKYDPISQREFYQLFAYFNQVPERGMNGFEPREAIPSPFASTAVRAIDEEIARWREELKQPLDSDADVNRWAGSLATASAGWSVLQPTAATSSGGSTLRILDDQSILAGEANPAKDVYDIRAETSATGLTAVRLQALTHPSLPGGGPGRHSNSNFVLSEIELEVVSLADPSRAEKVKFIRATADYSQQNYGIANAIDGSVRGNNGWAVDGPSRKAPATAIFVAQEPFGFEGGSELRFRLRHEASFATHGIGRPRFSVSADDPQDLAFDGVPAEVLHAASKRPADRTDDQQAALREYYLQHHSRRKQINDKIAEWEGRRNAAYPATMIMLDQQNARSTFVLDRGQYNAPADRVEPGVPAVFPPLAQDAPANRLGLARWLFDRSHPLTARVAVNRYWQQLFGIGLVKTAEDFGLQGEAPSHPQLLDWLAVEFIDSGWNVKHMLKLMLTSATYRQAADVGQQDYLRDPENRLLARGPRLRMTAEAIRDQALSVSGLLVHQLGGKSVYPYQPPGLWLELNNRPGYSREYQRGSGDDLYRRSLYTFWKRTVPSPMLKTLDAPEREFCTIQRSRTNTPLQSLLLLNGPQFVEAARHLAERIMREGGESLDERVVFGFRTVTSREPSDDERMLLKRYYAGQINRFRSDRNAAVHLLSVGDSDRDESLPLAEHAAWAMVGRLLLNLDEAITKG